MKKLQLRVNRMFVPMACSIFLAGVAAADCYEISNSDGFDAHTFFTFCDDAPSGLMLSSNAVRQHAEVSGSAQPGDINITISSDSVSLTATNAFGWGGRGGYGVPLPDVAAATQLAEAVNRGETIDISVSRAPSSDSFSVFSGVFELTFPPEMLPQSITPPVDEAESVESEPPQPVALSGFPAEIDQALSMNRKLIDWLDRDCIVSAADAKRAEVQTERLDALNEEIARYDATLADPNLGPRARPSIESRRASIIEERTRVQNFTSSRLSANEIFGRMMDDAMCRDRDSTKVAQLATCESKGRANCACEAEQFADNWMSGNYKVGSQGFVRMEVDARNQCRD